MNQSRDKILKAIDDALTTPATKQSMTPPADAPHYKPQLDDITEQFIQKFIATQGELFLCDSQQSMQAELGAFLNEKQMKNVYVWDKHIIAQVQGAPFNFKITETDFTEADCGITGCEALVARTGSILMSSAEQSGRRLGIYPPHHIVLARTGQLVREIADGLAFLQQKYNGNLPSLTGLITGPSRTADIEKTLVLGAHGPKALTLFLINE